MEKLAQVGAALPKQHRLYQEINPEEIIRLRTLSPIKVIIPPGSTYLDLWITMMREVVPIIGDDRDASVPERPTFMSPLPKVRILRADPPNQSPGLLRVSRAPFIPSPLRNEVSESSFRSESFPKRLRETADQ